MGRLRWVYLQFPQVFSTFLYTLQTLQKVPNSVLKLHKITYNIYFVLIIVFDPEFACLQTLSEVVKNLTRLWAFNALAFLGWGNGDCSSSVYHLGSHCLLGAAIVIGLCPDDKFSICQQWQSLLCFYNHPFLNFWVLRTSSLDCAWYRYDAAFVGVCSCHRIVPADHLLAAAYTYCPPKNEKMIRVSSLWSYTPI